MSDKMPVRSIVCVDGTWCDADGAFGNRKHTITNTYRLYVSIKEGESIEPSGKKFMQKKKYFPGIKAEDGISYGERLIGGISGSKCIDQIRQVYEHCCVETDKHNDSEVWLFGFSRGAFVVRAVAGLFHCIRALKSAGTPAFQDDFKQALRFYKSLQKQDKNRDGKIHSVLGEKTRVAPIIQFVGVFDTVKAVQDDRLYDISFNSSIQNMRHALALNEDRQRFAPDYIWPPFLDQTQVLEKRTFVQAWFFGGHTDIGGSAIRDGLSLYPLQWMFLESRRHGLVLRFDGTHGNRANIDNPLELTGLEDKTETWKCTTLNGIQFEMKDIRNTHKDPRWKGCYNIQLHRSASFWIKKYREPFHKGDLEGFYKFGPQGTILHPSVYLILDQFTHTALDTKLYPFYADLYTWRSNILGRNDDPSNGRFWRDSQSAAEPETLGPLRILVCGNSGVGKSTLINKVFGFDMAAESERKAGIHNIEEPFTNPSRPELVVHDSMGFEAGGEKELSSVEDFLKKKSRETDVNERLHVVWYCLRTSENRSTQAAQTALFNALSRYARDVPVVIIATFKDDFTGSMWYQGRSVLQQQSKPVTMEALEEYASQQLEQRLRQISGELEGRLQDHPSHDVVAVAKDDAKSIETLTLTTMQLLTDDTVRLLYIAAQNKRLDLKIDLAQAEAIKIYKRVLISSTALGGVPVALTTNRGAAAINICQAIIACFGVPTITAETIIQICKATLWDDMLNNARTTLAEITAGTSVVLSIFTGVPLFVIPMVTNVPLVVVATARLLLMLSCDITLILTRAFWVAMSKSIAKPERTDIQDAAVAYRAYCHEVHRKIKKRTNIIRCYMMGGIETLVTEILDEFKVKVVQGVSDSLPPNFERGYRAPSMYSKLSDDDDDDDSGSDDLMKG